MSKITENFKVLIFLCHRISKIAHEVFSVIVLVNFVSSIFIICFVSFQLTIDVSALELFKYFLFFAYQTMQIFMISYLGDYLTTCVSLLLFLGFLYFFYILEQECWLQGLRSTMVGPQYWFSEEYIVYNNKITGASRANC